MKPLKLTQINQFLLFSTVLIAGLYFGASLLIPFAFAILFATLVRPVADWMERKLRLGGVLSSTLCTLLVFIAVGGVSFLLAQQLGVFVNDLVDRRSEILKYIKEAQHALADQTGLPLERQEELLRERLTGLIDTTQKVVSSLLTNVTRFVIDFLLMLIYLFLLLLNRNKIVQFFMMYSSDENRDEMRSIIGQTGRVAQSYLWGRLQVMIILALMYIVLFTSYSLEHTLLLVVFGALITIIPYIGPFISGLLPIIFMIIYGHSFAAVLSFSILIIIIQLIESYVLEPVIIGQEVEQNPLSVILAVLLGGSIWGLAGLILFVPLFSILKIIFSHIPSLKPVAFLMGYEHPTSRDRWWKKLFTKNK